MSGASGGRLDASRSGLSISIVLPCHNEEASLEGVLAQIKSTLPDAEIILVDDGSDDDSAAIAANNGATVVAHPYSMGNGAAIKTGARHANGEILVFMDADGQHDPRDIPKMLDMMGKGYEMVVGARVSDTQANLWRGIANRIYNRLASWMTGFPIADLTSGFRVARARHFRKFLYLLPNGFSYPTTITMAFFRSALPLAYVPIHAGQRKGKSHIRILQDGFRFLVIILKVGALFSPMRLFLPISALLFLIGLGYYGYTFAFYRQFTNMSALLFMSSLLSFLIGLISEQISSLHYKGIDEDVRRVVR